MYSPMKWRSLEQFRHNLDGTELSSAQVENERFGYNSEIKKKRIYFSCGFSVYPMHRSPWMAYDQKWCLRIWQINHHSRHSTCEVMIHRSKLMEYCLYKICSPPTMFINMIQSTTPLQHQLRFKFLKMLRWNKLHNGLISDTVKK